MKIEQLEKRVDQLRGKPLMLLCMTPGGQEKRMTITECIATNSLFLRVLSGNDLNDFDRLMEYELNTAIAEGETK